MISLSGDYGQPQSTLLVITGIFGIAFFGFLGAIILPKLFHSKAGTVFTTEGFIDNASYAGGYLVRWSDVKDIEVITVVNQNFVSVMLNNPENYL